MRTARDILNEIKNICIEANSPKEDLNRISSLTNELDEVFCKMSKLLKVLRNNYERDEPINMGEDI